MKGVILAGGSGTRLHPLTRITNKHLLPIYDRPMIAYAIEALVAAGLEEIMLVTGGTHAGEFFRLLGNGHEHGVERLLYAYQEQAGGIAEALGLAERFVHGDKVVVMLADNIFQDSLAPGPRELRGAGARRARRPRPRRGGRAPAPPGRGRDGRRDRVARIVEKPDTPPSRFAVTGVYCYDASVWDVLPTLQPSGRGELEITDVNNYYAETGDAAGRRRRGLLGRCRRVDPGVLRGQRLRARERR